MNNHLQDLLEVITVGLPFCVFKLVTGKLLLFDIGLPVTGGILLVLGFMDLIINLVNVGFLIAKHRRGAGICTMTFLVGLFEGRAGRPSARLTEVAAALDVILSFILVVVMINAGLLAGLPRTEILMWNIAVSFNVIGAGYAQLSRAIRKLNDGDRQGATTGQ
ncbi:MAG TPA: hypothetical protein PKK50_02480 [Myxococcota bacterium]|nr:hypothetical protein [Myxococcota bacterium]